MLSSSLSVAIGESSSRPLISARPYDKDFGLVHTSTAPLDTCVWTYHFTCSISLLLSYPGETSSLTSFANTIPHRPCIRSSETEPSLQLILLQICLFPLACMQRSPLATRKLSTGLSCHAGDGNVASGIEGIVHADATCAVAPSALKQERQLQAVRTPCRLYLSLRAVCLSWMTKAMTCLVGHYSQGTVTPVRKGPKICQDHNLQCKSTEHKGKGMRWDGQAKQIDRNGNPDYCAERSRLLHYARMFLLCRTAKYAIP